MLNIIFTYQLYLYIIYYSYNIYNSIVMNNIKESIVKKKEVPQIKEEPTINDILNLL